MESNNRNDMPAFMDTDLDPYTLVHDIVSNWWVIILGAIAGALLTYVVVSSRYVPEYKRRRHLWWHPEAMRMRTVI